MLKVVVLLTSAKLLLLPMIFLLLDSHAHAGKERKLQSHLGVHKDQCLFIRFWARTLMSFSGLFLRYPSDADKHLLARQTGLSRNQVGPLSLSLSLSIYIYIIYH